MGDAVSSGLILPALALGLVGWLLPRGLARLFPEGVTALFLLAFCATVLVLIVAMVFFVLLYLMQGVPFAALLERGFGTALLHFLKLGSASALIWGPVLVLSVAGLPKRWVEETW